MTQTALETIQRNSSISFPMLGNLSINPPSYFTVFGIDVYLYGMMIGLGFILGILYCAKRSVRFGLKEDDVYDFSLWMLPLSILGARLYYVAFRLDYYLAHPSEFLAIRNGGLAIYGGIIAGVLVMVCVAKAKKIPVTAFLDLVTFGLLIGQILGRWGNFFNREAFGAITEVFCRMGLTAKDGTTVYVHPTFLYESLWNLCILIFLLIHDKMDKRKFDGQYFAFYLLFYGIGRAWIEGLRTDSLYIASTGIRVSQALSAVLVIASLVWFYLKSRDKSGAEALYVKRVNSQTEIENET